MENQDMERLAKARIYEVDENGKGKDGGVSVNCMFNPFEYNIAKSNSYEEQPQNNANVPQADFKKAGAATLTLSLTFDGYEKKQDITTETNKLWKLMEPQKGNDREKLPPPMVAFDWGVFHFQAVITQMTQKFTMFDKEGKPLRAKVDVTFTQYKDINQRPRQNQNPTSGNGPVERVWRVKSSDRIDTIAWQMYGDATQWRPIADHNRLTDPLDLRPGQLLLIPEEL